MPVLSKTFSGALLLTGLVLTVGCGHPTYYANTPPPPPPPEWHGPGPLVEMAETNGHRGGFEDGRRDLIQGRAYAPTRDAKYRRTPGYDPAVGPFGAYQQYYRNAYLRGYYDGFNRR